jgi:type IV pilus biogenesis protein CpaD/CtpE
MAFNKPIVCVMAVLLTACTAGPPAADQATISRSGGKAHDWQPVTEAELAAEVDAKLIEAARGFTKLRKDGEIIFCKRYKVISSTIPTIQCITQAQLRTQVEDMENYRDKMRVSGKCPLGPQGCSGN